mmetsp:Transcript_42509/g.129001  ORF Transcript_42509/g.129001 Transcript_42509/m.129001 type:complete len:97 (-) Transcript_42509:152-442(-)
MHMYDHPGGRRVGGSSGKVKSAAIDSTRRRLCTASIYRAETAYPVDNLRSREEEEEERSSSTYAMPPSVARPQCTCACPSESSLVESNQSYSLCPS